LDKAIPLITIHVHLYGILTDYAGIKVVDITVPDNITMTAFLMYFWNSLPETFRSQWKRPDDNKTIIKVFKNGELITTNMDTISLKDSDELRFFSAISGG